MGDGEEGRERRDSIPVDIMLIPDVSKEPNLTLWHKHGYTQGMDGRIAESLVVEASTAIEPVEIPLIRFAAEEIQIADLKVRKELTIVVVAGIMRV